MNRLFYLGIALVAILSITWSAGAVVFAGGDSDAVSTEYASPDATSAAVEGTDAISEEHGSTDAVTAEVAPEDAASAQSAPTDAVPSGPAPGEDESSRGDWSESHDQDMPHEGDWSDAHDTENPHEGTYESSTRQRDGISEEADDDADDDAATEEKGYWESGRMHDEMEGHHMKHETMAPSGESTDDAGEGAIKESPEESDESTDRGDWDYDTESDMDEGAESKW